MLPRTPEQRITSFFRRIDYHLREKKNARIRQKKNWEEIREYHKNWVRKNNEHVLLWKKEYRKKYPERVNKQNRQ